MFEINARYIISVEESTIEIDVNKEKNTELIKEEAERLRTEPVTEDNQNEIAICEALWNPPFMSSTTSLAAREYIFRKLELKERWETKSTYIVTYLQWDKVIVKEFEGWEFNIVNDWNFTIRKTYDSIAAAVESMI